MTSNEFATCISEYIFDQSENIREFVLVSDGCTYQNRNRVLATSLSKLARKRNVTIEQLYLEKGHTMMEADSVHATLEKMLAMA